MEPRSHQPEPNDPMRVFFSEALDDVFQNRLKMNHSREVQNYLGDMLVRLIHQDAIFSIRDAYGNRIESVSEMMLEGDVQFRATSFKREREVHRHIGDLMLFWSGIFPEALSWFKRGPDIALNPVVQGQKSYEIAAAFDHPPFDAEAPIFRQLSQEFEAYQFGLGLVRNQLPAFGQG